jgi:hypothetical protein
MKAILARIATIATVALAPTLVSCSSNCCCPRRECTVYSDPFEHLVVTNHDAKHRSINFTATATVDKNPVDLNAPSVTLAYGESFMFAPVEPGAAADHVELTVQALAIVDPAVPGDNAPNSVIVDVPDPETQVIFRLCLTVDDYDSSNDAYSYDPACGPGVEYGTKTR